MAALGGWMPLHFEVDNLHVPDDERLKRVLVVREPGSASDICGNPDIEVIQIYDTPDMDAIQSVVDVAPSSFLLQGSRRGRSHHKAGMGPASGRGPEASLRVARVQDVQGRRPHDF